MNDPLQSKLSNQKRGRNKTYMKRKWGKLNKYLEKKYISFNAFGWKMILPDEQTVVTSCMQFTKTLQKRWLPIASWFVSTEILTIHVFHCMLHNRNRGKIV